MVAFDNQDTHGREGRAMFLSKAAICSSVDGRKHGVVGETRVLFTVGSEPDVPVGMGGTEGME